MRCTEKACAKVNLTLCVGNKRQDGYHEVTSVMQRISLWDTVTVQRGTGRDRLLCDVPVTEDENDNLCMRAAKVFFAETGLKSDGVTVTLEKRIPMQAGLGGGSTAAASLLPPLTAGWFVVVKPAEGYATAEMYRRLDEPGSVLVRNSRYMQDAVAANNVHAVAAELHNSFERVVPKGSSLRTIKDALRARGALGTLLSGSGSAVFGLFDDREAALAAADALRETWSLTFLAQPV